MENYVGVKIVKAEPEEKSGLPGYRVLNKNGDISWMPKDDFEQMFQKVDMGFIASN